MLFQLLDVDYFLNGNKPVVRLYGKTENDNSICVFCENFQPYFYIKEKTDVPGAIKIEEVEKFLPLGYHEKPIKLQKVTLTNPQDVGVVREQLAADGVESYEADILFKYRFMIDHGLHGMDWIEFEGRKTHTNLVNIPAYVASSIKRVESYSNAPLKYMSFDIECLPSDVKRSIDAKMDPIIMIALTFYPDYRNKKNLVLVAKPVNENDAKGFRSEKEMLEEFLNIIRVYDPDIITGYNINSFDLPYLLERLKQNHLPANFGRCNDKYVYSKKFGMTEECTINGRIVVDPYQLLKRDPWLKFVRYDLNTIAKELLGEAKLDVEYSEMPELWNGTRDELSRFIEYARKDADLSIRLVLERRMLDKFIELAKVSGLLLQDTFGGQSTRVETMILHEFKKRNFVMPSKPTSSELTKRLKEREKKGLKGATVLEPNKGFYSDYVLVLDFKSLYPNIIRTYCISPDCLLLDGSDGIKSPSGAVFAKREVREGVFPFLLTKLLEARGIAKKAMKTVGKEEKKILNAKQLALKDMANSFYGYTGYIRARLYMIDVANAVTSYGRENIERTKKLIEDTFKVNVIYGDTDSIFLKVSVKSIDEANELGSKISKFVTDNLPGYLELEFDKIYRSFLILTKKRYAGWKFDYSDGKWVDSIDMRGIETVRRDWCSLVTETMNEILNIILKEGDVQKALNRMRDVVEKIKRNEIPMEKLTVVKEITKHVDSYEGILPHIELAKKLTNRNPHDVPKVGDRIGYIIIKGNQLLSKRAEDPKYAEKNRLQIDSDYYLSSQLFPPIERILNAVGITRSEMLGNGKQMNIFDMVNGKKSSSNELAGWEGFVCKKCNKSYRRMPLQGLCECGGELLLSYHGSVGNKIKI
ncbi:MAG: DNA polymerase domain-containing protein [Candidatus Aenigmatarchaeota archaeon]